MEIHHEKPNVIFIDDDSNILDSLRNSLRHMRSDWDIELFEDPSKALRYLLSSERGAVVVCDWMMPALDGSQICKQLAEARADNLISCFYVILLTGKSSTTDVVTALEFGADDFLSKPCDTSELIARIKVGIRVNRLEQGLRKANRDLRVIATTDLLTDLNNRRKAEDILGAELSRTVRGLQNLGAILIDLDHFKKINDTYGHDVGDMALKGAADALKEASRGYDSVSRWGGEEFLILCPHTDEHSIGVVAERGRQAIEAVVFELGNGDKVSLTASCGVYLALSGTSLSEREFIAGADRALYLAKENGRNRVEINTEST